VHGMNDERRGGSTASTHDDLARFHADPGTLYVVATPLGNLRDVTLRALDILGSVDIVAAEDTRVTSVLLRHYGITTHPLSVHAHNEAARAVEMVSLLQAGKSVALVTDAGTPAVSDPGARIVRAAIDAGLRVEPIPGPNAAVAAVSAAGLDAEHFCFLGFLPASVKARRDLLSMYAALPCALVIYEAPHRVAATIDSLVAILGGERTLIVARELTKKFETIVRLPLAAAAAWVADDANRQRGEFVLIVDGVRKGSGDAAAPPQPHEAERLLRLLIAELPPSRAARIVAEYTRLPRASLYARATAMKSDATPEDGDDERRDAD